MKTVMGWAGLAIGLAAAGVHAEVISFQQGDLRKDGVLIDSGYQTGSATLASHQPDTVQTSTGMYVGSHLVSGVPRYYRGLFAFDLSHIETVAEGNPYTIDSIAFNLTVANAVALPETTRFRAYATASFDEATATWNNPGTNHVAGGNVGLPFALRNVTSAMASTAGSVVDFNATVPGNMSAAITNALAGDKILYILVKQEEENGLASYYFRPAADHHATVDYRPELLVGLTVSQEETPFANILGFVPQAGNIVKMTVHASSFEDAYPQATTDLAFGSWASVSHSSDGLADFVETNLSYSTASDTNVVIFVKADESAQFFRIAL